MKALKLNLDDIDLYGWIASVERFLDYYEVLPADRVSVAAVHLTGGASLWKIYNHNIDLLVATGEAENCTLQPANALILLSYIDTKESTWITSVDNVAFTSLIPTTLTSDTLFAVEHNDGGIIGVLGKFNGVYQCGQTHTSQTTIESRFPVVVPPMSKVKVSLLATKASCNIPFYYSQQDNLISPHPRTITYHKEGGVYTG
ncbi:PREDICTED: Hfr-2, partial [Prunus dulcis]